jgi:pSer/pThr/pTyr-binding forkhead associated (FHA) protein
VSSGVLTLFKYVFLAVLYLFFLRVLRAVWVELREPKVAPVSAAQAGAAGTAEAPAGRKRRGKDEPTHLVVSAPPERVGQTFDLADELTVGRAPGCGVSLPEDTFTSQLHARVFRRDGDVWVEDLGSTNGTLLNDRRVSAPAVMRRGDRLQVGRTILELSS